ncbi:hypothetical protein FOMPIDRAFT_1048541 [Fomitopsis schrenkii]|uniref:Peptidase A1 domain-containing protein n=1 Tax=Fomitopsis schrenkii TaxID=2126942 RepID=S8EAG6_FOMSC|nr:hypothetical protein FOMPIDRAFT_1048541 [Fomitopsis schrenkii]
MLIKSRGGLKCAAAAALLSAPLAEAANTFIAPWKSTLAANSEPDAPTINAALKVVVAVQAGDNQTFNEVLVDTGSAILWVGAQTAYEPGPYTEVINETFSVGYGVGGVNGTAYKDRVTIGEATVQSQIIGDAEWIHGFALEKPIDGILGLGPSGSNAGEVSGSNTTPTFVENLVSEGTIDEPVFGIYVGPFSDDAESAGEITFGGVDESRISGDVEWFAQTSNLHWTFNATSFKLGNVSVGSPLYATTDTGVLPLGIPFDEFIAALDTYPGSTLDESSLLTGGLIFPSNISTADLPVLEIGLGNLLFNITADQYIVPKNLYSALNITDDGNTHTWIASGGPSALTLGQTFLEHAYSAYDMKNQQIGFAYLA